jgi:type II secretion system protein N
MKQFFIKYKKWIGYALYGIILTFALLFYRFPSDALTDYLQAAVRSRNPDLSITFKKASLAFPLALRLTGAELFLQKNPENVLFQTNEIIIRPKIWSMFSKNPEYRFTCNVYDGTITGSINLQKNGQEPAFKSSVEFKNIQINDKSPLPAIIKNYIGGVLEGALTYSGGDLFDPKSEGEASLTLSKGAFKLATPILNISNIDFKEVVIKANLKDQLLNISDINLKGDSFLGQASGAITLKNSFKKSLVGFKGSIEPTAVSVQKSAGGDAAQLLLKQSLKKGKLSFIIQGTIDKPSFRLL